MILKEQPSSPRRFLLASSAGLLLLAILPGVWSFAEYRVRDLTNWTPAEARVAKADYIVHEGEATIDVVLSVGGTEVPSTLVLNKEDVDAFVHLDDLNRRQGARAFRGLFGTYEVCLETGWEACFEKKQRLFLLPLLATVLLLVCAGGVLRDALKHPS